MNEYADQIRSSGHRLTRQRKLILEILEGSREHLDADTIHDRAKVRDSSISLATVYRSLGLLKDIGLVQENLLGEGHGHFEMTQSAPHYHFTCLKCGRVVEFEASQLMEVTRKLCNNEGLQVTEAQLLLRGYCSECREDRSGCE
jgi:Fe2+ or Zn2+ uptake regulation protein